MKTYVDQNLPSPIGVNMARNRAHPSSTVFRQIARRTNQLLINRQAYLGSLFVPLEAPYSSINGLSAMRLKFRSGVGPGLKFVCEVLMDGQRPHQASTAAFLSYDLTEVGVATTTKTFFRHDNISVGSTVTPSHLWRDVVKFDITAKTEYEFAMIPFQNAMVQSACAYLECVPAVDDTVDGAVDEGTIGQVGSPILAAEVQDLLEAHVDLLRYNHGGYLMYYQAKPGAHITTTSTSYVNLLDTALGTGGMGANSPGYVIDLQHRNLLGSAEIPVRLSVRAEQDGAENRGEVALFETGTPGSPAINVTGIGTIGWYTATGTLAASDLKYDLMAQLTAASATAVDVTAAMLEIYYP